MVHFLNGLHTHVLDAGFPNSLLDEHAKALQRSELRFRAGERSSRPHMFTAQGDKYPSPRPAGGGGGDLKGERARGPGAGGVARALSLL